MGDWWTTLETIERVYWAIAIPSTIIFLIFLLLSVFAGADGDADIDMDGDIGFQFISLKNLLGFFAVFSWAGLAALEAGQSNTSSILTASIAGLSMMFLMAGIFYLMSRLTDDGTLQMKNALNQIGEVYLTIPEKRTGYGKVQIRVQGRLHELEAITDHEETIPSGKLVTVVDVLGDELLLVRLNG